MADDYFLIERDLLNEICDEYGNYLEEIGHRDAAIHYHHPGLNCRYGVELEFLSSSNRYALGNRVNSCMWNHLSFVLAEQ